jgi:hypothetical protein
VEARTYLETIMEKLGDSVLGARMKAVGELLASYDFKGARKSLDVIVRDIGTRPGS